MSLLPHRIFAKLVLFFATFSLNAQSNTALIVEAEDAVLGSSLSQSSSEGVTYIAPDVDFTRSAPDSEDTLATFTLTFPEAGDYELYARIYIGPEGANDDSMIVSTAFGTTAIDNAEAWTVANGLFNLGYSEPENLILSSGSTGTESWKWIRVSSHSNLGILTVPDSQLTQSYRISSREDGLRLDKLAFGPLRVTFTVNQLDNNLPGLSQDDPGGEIFQSSGPIIAHNKSKFLGSVWSGTSAYNKDFEFYWNGMWHGNAGKWGTVEATRDVMNWTVLDQGYLYAKANKVKFNFHVLLWGSQQPSWIDDLPVEEKREEIIEWMQAVADRYPDIDYLQVVNEPINAPADGSQNPWQSQPTANYADALGGYGETGFEWIIEGFRLARQIFPDTPLMINEYSVEGNQSLADEYLEIIQALQAEDLIDLIGFQGHAFSTQSSTVSDMEAILDKIAATGLPIMLTEMEIDGFDDFVQLEEYKRVFPIYWDHPSVIGINISGHIGNWRADQGAVLVNDNFSERPALKWIREYVEASPWNNFRGYLAERGLDPATHTITSDIDHDGRPAGLEFLLSLDPESPSFGPYWTWPQDQASITIPLSPNIKDGTVSIESSSDLQDWKTEASYRLDLFAGDGFEIADAEGIRSLTFTAPPNNSASRFYRIKYIIPQ
ncbi:Glycosyl hydrolase family 10 protein [Verrucomicrobiia bacterium DG1235]|nr:Glycosyl hydrolase family 10 protein [Verrucomicrobiae bacterium DG1235]